jgi:hypothetical protein
VDGGNLEKRRIKELKGILNKKSIVLGVPNALPLLLTCPSKS